MSISWSIVPMSDRCLIIEFGQTVEPVINDTVRNFAAQMLNTPMPGIVDVVPAFTTVTLHYEPRCFRSVSSPYESLRLQLEALLTAGIRDKNHEGRTVEIPVCYGGEYGIDLEEVARACHLEPEAVIKLHVASPHKVYMLGFLPGLAQIGGLDKRLSVPRRSTPRISIAAGSVAIAHDQTCIYPLESPGGWNVIGRTPLRMFDASRESPCLLQPGDHINFTPIPAEAFEDAKWA